MTLRTLALATLVGWTLAASAATETLPSVMLDDLTWPELKAQIAAGKTTIIVPVGGTEQSGPHMALGKHNVRVRMLSERIARALGNALVAPVIAYVPEGSIDPPAGHLRYPGTITVPDAAFEAVLESAARSFRLHGFRDIVFLGDHGGYQRDLTAVAARLNREWAAAPARAHAIVEYYRVSSERYAKLLKERGVSADEIGTHAGLADTSLMLALDPSLVRPDRMQSPPVRSDGVYGDPRRSSAALGQAGVDVIVSESVAAIRKAVSQR